MLHAEPVLRLVAAAAAGSIVGFERERLMLATGLRTHMLVCVGACLAMIVSAHGSGECFGKVMSPSILRGSRPRSSPA